MTPGCQSRDILPVEGRYGHDGSGTQKAASLDFLTNDFNSLPVLFLTLSDQFVLTFSQWVLICIGSFALGMSKAGIKGLGIVMITILAIVFGARASTGILVPMLIVADIFAVWYYHRHAQWKYLILLLPWLLLGVLLGVWFGNKLSEQSFKYGMSAIILIGALAMLWREYRPILDRPPRKWFGVSMGLLAGFATMIGNLAGAFANLYLLAMRLPKKHFIATGAWLFFIVNLFKLPFHIWSWKTVTMDTVALNIRLLPAMFLGFIVGLVVVKYLSEKRFRQIVIVLMLIGAIAMII